MIKTIDKALASTFGSQLKVADEVFKAQKMIENLVVPPAMRSVFQMEKMFADHARLMGAVTTSHEATRIGAQFDKRTECTLQRDVRSMLDAYRIAEEKLQLNKMVDSPRRDMDRTIEKLQLGDDLARQFARLATATRASSPSAVTCSAVWIDRARHSDRQRGRPQ